MLLMAKGDPLRAMEIEAELSEEWYWRWDDFVSLGGMKLIYT